MSKAAKRSNSVRMTVSFLSNAQMISLFTQTKAVSISTVIFLEPIEMAHASSFD